MRLAVVLGIVLLAAVTGSVTVQDAPYAIAVGETETTSSTDLNVDFYQLTTDQNGTTGATVGVNSTAASSLEARVTVTLRTVGGDVVATTNTTVMLGTGGQQRVDVQFSRSYEPGSYARVQILLEKTL